MATRTRPCTRAPRRQAGTTLLEVMITVIVLAFGLLGIAAFQAKAQVGSIEAYQRAQAVVLLQDMQARINSNGGVAAAYVTTTPLGTGDGQSSSCSTLALGPARDQCEWSNALKGAAETKAGALIGSMTGARGCITQVQAMDATPSVCTPGIYQVTVAWQGLHPTKAPAQACGQGAYGADNNRRAISARVAIGMTGCN